MKDLVLNAVSKIMNLDENFTPENAFGVIQTCASSFPQSPFGFHLQVVVLLVNAYVCLSFFL